MRLLLPLGILAWLIWDLRARHPDQLADLFSRPKDWRYLAAAAVTLLLAISLSFVRWYLLVAALGIPFRLRDAFRLGFLGYLFNFVSLGGVGGDLFKAYFVAREQKGRRTEAVATVVLDRIVGLYALVLLTALVLCDPATHTAPSVRFLGYTVHLAVAASAIGLLFVFLPESVGRQIGPRLARLPVIGLTMERVVAALQLYRHRKTTLAAILAVSLTVHGLIAGSTYLTAKGIFDRCPSMREHLVITPLANIANGLPLSPGGLGTLELAMDSLYDHVPVDGSGAGKGFIVAVGYRLEMMLVAAVGVICYWNARRTVQEVLDESAQSLSTTAGIPVS